MKGFLSYVSVLMTCKLLGRNTFESAVQFSKAPLPMFVMLVPKYIFCNPLQFINAQSPKSSKVSGREMEVIALQPLKAYESIFLRFAPKETETRFLQPLNAEFPIEVQLSGMTRVEIDVPLNASC